jgi:hypothetical protein
MSKFIPQLTAVGRSIVAEKGRTTLEVAQCADESLATLFAASPKLLNLAKQIAPMIKSGQLELLCDLAEIVIEQTEGDKK